MGFEGKGVLSLKRCPGELEKKVVYFILGLQSEPCPPPYSPYSFGPWEGRLPLSPGYTPSQYCLEHSHVLVCSISCVTRHLENSQSKKHGISFYRK